MTGSQSAPVFAGKTSQAYITTIKQPIPGYMTTGSKPAPFRIAVGFAGKDGLVLLDQIRALDKTRLVKKMGALPPATLTATLTTLQEVFAA